MASSPNISDQILATCRSALLVDWPSPEVPAALVRAGWTVYAKGGPGPDDFSVWELRDGSPASRKTERRPTQIDLVYVYRPFEELPGIIAIAQEMAARALWYESGSTLGEAAARARSLVEAAGLLYVDDQDIVAALRAG